MIGVNHDRTAFRPCRPGPYRARSASDHRQDWPHWLVEGSGGINAAKTARGETLTSREVAEALAAEWNRKAS